MYMLKSIDDVKLFVLIYEKLSLSVVAELLQTTPSFISKRLAQLETDLGHRLFHRTTRNIHPTEEGNRFFSQAQHLLEIIESYENDWNHDHEPSGTIRITASASFARLYLMPLMTGFLKKYPKVRISFELSDKVLDIVAEGIDLAIRGAQLPDSSLIARKLGPNREVLCATKSYLENSQELKQPEDLRNHNCIILNDNYNWEFNVGPKPTFQKVSGNFKTNYSEALVSAIKDDLGIGMVCYWQIHEEIQNGELQLVLPEFNPGRNQSMYAVYPSRKQFPLKTKALIEYLEVNLKIPAI